jgi:hypothetical protein
LAEEKEKKQTERRKESCVFVLQFAINFGGSQQVRKKHTDRGAHSTLSAFSRAVFTIDR